MGRTEFAPFDEEHLTEAGRLLAWRHAAHRSIEPQLDSRYAEPEGALSEVVRWWGEPGASGAVAIRNGQLVGYLVAAPKPAEVWGPNVWVEAAGQAVFEPEDLRDLYGLAATRWVEEGRLAHYVVVPMLDPAVVDSWFRLGFGQQHVHALRESDSRIAFRSPDGFRIRRAATEDIPSLAELDLALPRHQAASPVFSAGEVPTLEEALADWEGSIDDSTYGAFVAESEGRVVGSAVGAPAHLSSIHRGLALPDHAAVLGFAAVFPSDRRRGIGTALAAAVLEWAVESGYPVTVTDWRATNLLSSRRWPTLGFRPTFLRLHRLIGY